MKLYRPVQCTIITQGFGPDKTSPQMLPFYQSLGLIAHNGVDFGVIPCQTIDGGIWSKNVICSPVYWDCDTEGTVYKLSTDVNVGLGVWVNSKDSDGTFKHRFWHLSQIKCQVGQILGTGDLIGLAGNTGYSTGAHLHRDLTPLNEDLTNKLGNNGYDGCTDPAPYFESIFVLDKIKYMQDTISNLQQQISIIQKILNLIKLLNPFKK